MSQRRPVDDGETVEPISSGLRFEDAVEPIGIVGTPVTVKSIGSTVLESGCGGGYVPPSTDHHWTVLGADRTTGLVNAVGSWTVDD